MGSFEPRFSNLDHCRIHFLFVRVPFLSGVVLSCPDIITVVLVRQVLFECQFCACGILNGG